MNQTEHTVLGIDIAPSPALAAHAAALRAHLTSARDLQGALDRLAATRAEAVADAEARRAALAVAHVQRAKAAPDAPSDSAVRKLIASVADAATAVEAVATAHAAVLGELRQVEASLKAEPQFGSSSITGRFASEVTARWTVGAHEAICKALSPLIVQAHALEVVLGDVRLYEWSRALRIDAVGAVGAAAPLVEGDRVVGADGVRMPTREASASLVEALRAAGCGALRDLHIEVTSHRPRAFEL